MNEPRRILHLISRLDGYGGARMLRYLAASQTAAGDRVTVAAFTADPEVVMSLERQGVTVRVLDSRWPADFVALSRLLRMHRQTAAHVVHVWDVVSLMQAVLTSLRASDEVLLATLDIDHVEKQWTSRAVRMLGKRIRSFVATDELAHSWFKRHGVAEDRVKLIPPGMPPVADSMRSRGQLQTELALAEDAQVIAVAGPLRRQKKVDEAIWCFELVRVLHENARLLIFGDGPDRERLERFAEEVSDPGCVLFLGYRADFREQLSAIDVFWQLDASATIPLALLEAQAAGVPVVASDVPSRGAAIVHDETGLLVPLGHRAEVTRATDRLFADAELARRIGESAARSVAERWSWDAARESYDRLYDQLLTKTAG